jgi:hypothetical protein
MSVPKAEPAIFAAAKSSTESFSNKPGGTAGSVHKYAPPPGHGTSPGAPPSSFPRVERGAAQPFPTPMPTAPGQPSGSLGTGRGTVIFPAAKH